MLKKNSKILVALFLILALVSSFSFATVEPRTVEEDEASNVVLDETTATISDDETSTDEDATSSENSWVNNDLFISEDTVNVSDVVDGNAFICGKDVTISGEIGGDLFVVADKLTISGGYVYSSIFACANEITIN